MLRTSLCVFLILSVTADFAQSQDQVEELRIIREAVATGDVDGLLSLSAGSIELALFAASRQYTRSQARLVLVRFFKQNPPTGMEVVESSRSATGLFVEAKVRTSNFSKPLRVYLRLNLSSDGWKLRELLIESPER